MLQNYLPKKYALLEFKPGKRNAAGSGMKFVENDVQSLLSVEPKLVQIIRKL